MGSHNLIWILDLFFKKWSMNSDFNPSRILLWISVYAGSNSTILVTGKLTHNIPSMIYRYTHAVILTHIIFINGLYSNSLPITVLLLAKLGAGVIWSQPAIRFEPPVVLEVHLNRFGKCDATSLHHDVTTVSLLDPGFSWISIAWCVVEAFRKIGSMVSR